MTRVEAPLMQDGDDRFAPLNREIFRYFREIENTAEFRIKHPGIERVKIFGNHHADKGPGYTALRLEFRSSPESEIPSPYALYIFNEDGSAFTYPSPELIKTRQTMYEGARPEEASYGFLGTVVQALHEEDPLQFADPRPLVDHFMDLTHTLAS